MAILLLNWTEVAVALPLPETGQARLIIPFCNQLPMVCSILWFRGAKRRRWHCCCHFKLEREREGKEGRSYLAQVLGQGVWCLNISPRALQNFIDLLKRKSVFITADIYLKNVLISEWGQTIISNHIKIHQSRCKSFHCCSDARKHQLV